MHAPILWQNAVVLQRLTERKEWKFFAVLPKAARGLATLWWASLLLRGILPAVFAIAMGVLVGAVQRGNPLAGPLAFVGVIFVLLQVLSPIHQAVSANLGDRTAAWLYDRLTEACVRPPGMGHLEDPTLSGDLTVARDFDLGMTGPPLSFSMDFIASGMVEMIGGVASALILPRSHWWGATLARGPRCGARTRLRLPAGGGSAREQGVAAIRPQRLDDRPFHRPTHSLARAAVRGHASARASCHLERAARRLREPPGVLVPRERRCHCPHQPWGSRRLHTMCHRRFDDRVRRIQLGARRCGCPGRRGAATRAR